MILDLEQFPDDAELVCDICIVGAGPAGIALALELAGPRRDIIVLESGGLQIEPATRELNRAQITGHAYAGAWHGRARVLGGATTLWGGQALPLTPSDLAERSWVPHSGWPMEWAELDRRYPRARHFLGLDDRTDDELFALLRVRPPAFDPTRVRYQFSNWCPVPDMAQRHGASLRRSAGIRVVLHANVVELGVAESGEAIRHVAARTLGGRRLRVKSSQVVLSAGGLETARLLLMGSERVPEGIGNAQGMVGRFLQDHPGARIGTLVPHDAERVQRLFNVFHKADQKYSVRCSATPALQRERSMLNASAAIMFEIGPDSAFAAARDAYHLLRRGAWSASLLQRLGRAALGAPELLRPVYELYVHGRNWTPGATMGVYISLEQQPDADSRLRLSPTRDALGSPMLEIDWRIGERAMHACREYASELARQFRSAGLGELALERWVTDVTEDWERHLGDHYHHLGTTRMSRSPREGVVDEHCRVHGMANLHVASASVFPTGGHSNPTLTLLALCYRLADRLRAVM